MEDGARLAIQAPATFVPVALRQVRRLSSADLELLARLAPGLTAGELGRDPAAVDRLLEAPATYRRLFGGAQAEPFVFVSPVLVFSVLVARARRELLEASYVDEWMAPGRRVPVFDTAALDEFLADAEHRVFLAELLASYTRVASGSVWTRTARGWRRVPYSELDPVRLAELAELAGPGERTTVLRRLGDLALFLSGVFPDHAAARPLAARQLARIQRQLMAAGDGVRGLGDLAAAGGGQAPILTLEWMGRSAYRAARQLAAAGSDLLPGDIVDRFASARRVLNFITDRHLFPTRERWFGG